MLDGRVCNSCKSVVPRNILDKNYSVCPNCGGYLRFHARKRIKSLDDYDTFLEWDASLKYSRQIQDEDYEKKLVETFSKHKLNDAIITGEISIEGQSVAIGVMDTRFMMASMGHVVGEKVTRLFERATSRKMPVILFCCSGGARMQEGIISLMQMEKTAAAVKKHSDMGLLYISILTNPTMGGVTASFAMLADIILAEKGAMIGFAGKRVIEQNTGEKLPVNFQTAEFQLEHGFVDNVISRDDLKDQICKLLSLHKNRKSVFKFSFYPSIARKSNTNFRNLSRWQRVKIARAQDRPTSLDYINSICDDFVELHGDRDSADDHAIVGGIGSIKGKPVTIIAQQKGKTSLEEAMYRNWGMAKQSGYRKALRLMEQAEKFNRPIICLIDTVGAACGKEAEERGEGEAIAKLLRETSTIEVPVLSIIISEGGSGGALALGVGNEVWMMENAVYSILSPEGYASILWKDNKRAADAAEIMKMTAHDLLDLGVIEKVIYEPDHLTLENMMEVCDYLRNEIVDFIVRYEKKSRRALTGQRYQRFRKY